VVQSEAVACYVYREFWSKDKQQGGVTSLNQKTKMVKQYATESARCNVKILDRYLKSGARQKDISYLQPPSGTSTDPSAPWFKNVAVGRNIDQKYM